MSWVIPEFSREEVNRSGKLLAEASKEQVAFWTIAMTKQYFRSLDVVNNWRAAHGYPLNILQNNLRKTAKRFDKNPIVAQRVKT